MEFLGRFLLMTSICFFFLIFIVFIDRCFYMYCICNLDYLDYCLYPIKDFYWQINKMNEWMNNDGLVCFNVLYEVLFVIDTNSVIDFIVLFIDKVVCYNCYYCIHFIWIMDYFYICGVVITCMDCLKYWSIKKNKIWQKTCIRAVKHAWK
jgi:hypothetical protein